MLDIKFIRANQDIIAATLKNKKSDVILSDLLDLDEQRRSLLSTIEELNKQKNDLARQTAQDTTNTELINQGKKLKLELEELESRYQEADQAFQALMLRVPNVPSDDTPIGPDESGNVVLREVGDKPSFDFKPKEHWQLGKELDLIDTETAGTVAGPRFAYLKGNLVLLEFALVQYVLSILTSSTNLATIIATAGLNVPATPFTPIIPPLFIKPDVFQKMARLEPRDERYHIPSDDLYLIGSAEHTLGPLHIDQILKEDTLPIRYVGLSTAFRREAGSYGKDTKGILRLHQFDKIEMESFTLPQQGLAEQDFFVAIQEHLMSSLGLAYRIVITCTGDMGDPDARHIDLETWMPGQDQYRETHSADYMTDYQARRLNTRVKRTGGNEYVHMNDATALAGRALIAIMENYQTAAGTIRIPEVLQPYMFGITEIK